MRTIVSIPGIHCEGCAALIKDVSGDFPEIAKVDVDLNTKHVTLDHEEGFAFDAWKDEVEALDEQYIVHPA